MNKVLWKSQAVWPDHTKIGCSSDTHESGEAATAVCRMLKRLGLGGLGKIFPTSVWVTDPSGNTTLID